MRAAGQVKQPDSGQLNPTLIDTASRYIREKHSQNPSIAHAHTRGRILLSPEVDESESRRNLFANIRGHIGFRVCRCDLCN